METIDFFSDKYFMKQALSEAQKAFDKNEVPIGAIVVSKNRIIARAHNLTETLNDPTAHAEMQAITAATNYIGAKYLKNCTLYVTLEPCTMCAGALYWSQISKLVFGAEDFKKGYRNNCKTALHPKTELFFGILEDECSFILKEFFEEIRGK